MSGWATRVVYHSSAQSCAKLVIHTSGRSSHMSTLMFLQIHKEVFDKHYKQQYLEAGLLDKTRGELQHLISDAATMQVWTFVWTGEG